MSPETYVQAPPPVPERVIADVTVVDVAAGRLLAHRDVRIAGDRIAAVTEHDRSLPASDQVIDGAGRFLVPAFVDAHAHPLNHPDEVDGPYALMLAAGVCGYRQMSGSDDVLHRRAAGTLREPVGAPRLLALTGELLTPLNAGNERTTAATVRHEAEHGADFIKAGFTSARTFMAALRAANEAGIPLAAHLPDDLDPRDAIREGLRCIEHLGPRTALVGAASRREEQVRSMSRSLPTLPPLGFLSRFVDKPLLKLVVNPSKSTSPQAAATIELATRTMDERKARELAELMAEHETWNCPTLIRLHTQYFGDRPLHLDDQRQKYIHPEELENWRQASQTLSELPERTREAMAEDFEAKLRMTAILDAAGAPMLAGTDADGAGWVIPGFALHDEFDLLARAGLSPLRILQMATADAARFFHREERSGQVAEGFDADLVLLDADPLRDHRNLHGIAGVVRDGAWYPREELDAVLERVAAHPTVR